MKCSLCGYEFNEKNRSNAACASCPMSHGCELIRCPSCGFEVPSEPRWLKKVTDFLRRGKDDSRRDNAGKTKATDKGGTS